VVRRHLEASPDPALPVLGSLRLDELTVDHVADWSAANERALAPTTAVIALITLKAVCRFAIRRGWLAENPVLALDPSERPRWSPGRVGVLEGPALVRVLDQAGSDRPLFKLLAFTGLRIGEALGLTWADVDLDAGLLSVHRQLSRYREHAKLKTEAGRRQIVLAPAMVRLLRARWLASAAKGPDDFVFLNRVGRPLDYRHVGDNFRLAVRRSGVRADGRLSLHSLRHGYASLLIAEGLDVVFVSRKLGHADPGVRLSVYAHLFARAKHALAARSALEAGYASMALVRS
jgi:integrase